VGRTFSLARSASFGFSRCSRSAGTMIVPRLASPLLRAAATSSLPETSSPLDFRPGRQITRPSAANQLDDVDTAAVVNGVHKIAKSFLVSNRDCLTPSRSNETASR